MIFVSSKLNESARTCHHKYFFAPVSGLTQPDTLQVAPKKIKILSWNIYMLPGFLGHGKKPRAEAIGQILASSDYDVIVFQEAFDGKARKIISRLLQPAFPFQGRACQTENAFTQDPQRNLDCKQAPYRYILCHGVQDTTRG